MTAFSFINHTVFQLNQNFIKSVKYLIYFVGKVFIQHIISPKNFVLIINKSSKLKQQKEYSTLFIHILRNKILPY